MSETTTMCECGHPHARWYPRTEREIIDPACRFGLCKCVEFRPVPAAPAPEAARETDADKLLDELVRSIGDPAAFRVARERLRAALAAAETEATRRVPYRLIAEDAAIRPAAMSVVKPSEAVALLNATVDENERLRATLAAQAREIETLRDLLSDARNFATAIANADAYYGEQNDDAILLGDRIDAALAARPEET